jgi:hypothetical protein
MGRGGVLRLGQTIEQLDDLTQTIEVEQVLGSLGGRTFPKRSVVGAAEGDGGVAPVGEHDNQVRIVPAAKANDLDTLAPKRMMGMGDGDESRRWLGWRGSVLWVSPASRTA